MNENQKVIVPERSLYARIAARVKKEGRILRQNRQASGYLLIDRQQGVVVSQYASLEDAGRGLGALNAWEVVGA